MAQVAAEAAARDELKLCIDRMSAKIARAEAVERLQNTETAFLLELYCRGSVSMTVKWVLSGMRTSSAELARYMTDALPGPLRELFTRIDLL